MTSRAEALIADAGRFKVCENKNAGVVLGRAQIKGIFLGRYIGTYLNKLC